MLISWEKGFFGGVLYPRKAESLKNLEISSVLKKQKILIMYYFKPIKSEVSVVLPVFSTSRFML